MSQNTNSQHILIVDDNVNNLKILSDILNVTGWEISVALDGENALEQINYFLPDLILLDVMMPKTNGYQTCRLIKANPDYLEIPIIFITALSATNNKLEGFKLGAVDYITKPFHQEEILARVRVHLKLRQLSKTLESQNIMLKSSLEQEKKLNELKSRFVTMVSHEFRTPLTSILSSTELIEYYSCKGIKEKTLNHLHRIQASVNQMTELLNDVLILGKADAGKLKLNPTPINLVQFCEELVKEIQLNTKTHQIIFHSHSESCLEVNGTSLQHSGNTKNDYSNVSMDEKILRYILNNLLSNGIKYSPDSDQVIFELICQSRQAIFRIQDFGIGIPLSEQKELFDSFHRANNVGSIPGTGLGLSIVKKSVDLYGGTIAMNSQVGLGTTFTVTLPYLDLLITDFHVKKSP